MRHLVLVTFLLASWLAGAQGSFPYQKEVEAIKKRNDSIWDSTKETIVFTGSSSIRFWEDLQQRFPNRQVLNAGFGGSEAIDLLHHLNDLVLHFKPVKVFIYEGDNDIYNKKRPAEVLGTFLEIVNRIQKDHPNREIVLISAKPSISRWRFRGKYKRLNKKLRKYAAKDDRVGFVDVWKPMLDGRKLRTDIFIEDGLHMNQKGYDIWYSVIKDFVK